MITTRQETKAEYRRILIQAKSIGQEWETLRELNKRDLFFLLVYTCNRKDADNDWVFARCREVQAQKYGYLDLWAREHYKSTIITFACTIQDIINHPEWTTCILSFTRPIAKAFLRQIKFEAETNVKLKYLHPDVFWQDPKKEAPKWSEDGGLVFKRKGNPKEATLEAWGLIDGQPTSKHFKKLLYNDIVTKDTVTTPDMIKKTTESWELSLNLGMKSGVMQGEGTFYHYNDTYHTIINRKALIPRIYTATVDGTREGKPVLWTREYLAKKVRTMGPYTSACQLFLDPVMDKAQGFRQEWLRYWQARNYKNMNIYIVCDPAGEKKKENDYTCFWVIGLGQDQNYYVITGIRDRLNLTERANVLFSLHQQYRPVRVGYQKYGKDSDIQHYEYRMAQDNYRFSIDPIGEIVPKNDRIKRLIPVFSEGRIFLPESIIRVNYEGQTEDLTQIFVNTEYLAFPYCEHDDMLDCLADIMSPDFSTVFPQGKLADVFNTGRKAEAEEYDPLGRK